MPSPADYRLRVTAGTSYDPATHVDVAVNNPKPLVLHGPGADVALNVRIKDYRPHAEGAPTTCEPYFSSAPHKTNDDTYSIGVWFVPRAPESNGGAAKAQTGDSDGGSAAPTSPPGISAHDLQWGNDFDRPIRAWLPPGFGTALRIVKWWIDPGLEGDPYADRPYLYGPAVSSFNRVYAAHGDGAAAERSGDPKKGEDFSPPTDDGKGLWFPEGGDAAGRTWREAIGCPVGQEDADSEDAEDVGPARMKWALGKEAKDQWVWQYGKGYGLDFYNGFLDFQQLALRLPGFHMPLLRFWDGRTSLRYVLRHRQTGEVYLVVVFNLVKVGGKEGGGEEGEEQHHDAQHDDHHFDEEAALAEARRKLSTPGDEGPDVHLEDVD